MKLLTITNLLTLLSTCIILTACRKYEPRTTYHDNGTTQAHWQVTWYLEQWVRCGPFVEYYPDGKPQRKGKWYYERLMRNLREYDSTGNWIDTFYRFGSKFGERSYALSNGFVWKTETYENDVLNGPYTEYYTNGQPKVEGYYDPYRTRSGRAIWSRPVKNGEWVYYDMEGTVTNVVVWENGRLGGSEK